MTISIEDFKIYEIDYGQSIPQKEIKWITGLNNLIEFTGNEFGEHAQLRDWCLENCDNKVVFIEKTDIRHDKTIIMYFYNEHDAAAAKLRWL